MSGAGARMAVLLDGHTGGDRELLGGKAAGIERMLALGAPVPPAFVLTTAVCRQFHAESRQVPADVWEQVPAMVRELERATGRTFGRGPDPLLVSVRSGAATSMPGMMDTILNIGMTTQVERALDVHNPEHAADTRRRFAEQFAKVAGRQAPADPWRQLKVAIGSVLESWNSPRAVAYRRDHGLHPDSGTAVTVQAMVFGNMDGRSGTGVVFSRDPLTGDADVYGEWLARGQGEDVVSGRVDAAPLAELGRDMPDVHQELLAWTRVLERAGRDVQDIEFTVESGTLWLLQSRAAKRSPEAAVRHAVAMAREGLIGRDEALGRVTPAQVDALMRPRIDPVQAAAYTVLARGKPACPGVGIGVVDVDSDMVEERAACGADLVLARPMTEPEDISAMAKARAVLTESGGSTSHAALVCRELAIPCVVGCGIGTVTTLSGRVVTVDGSGGVVYEGALPIRPPETVDGSDLATLAEWARCEPSAPIGRSLRRSVRVSGRIPG